ncbi:MAG: hypothetical protein V4542_00560 [Pseudomonadota bacterium]
MFYMTVKCKHPSGETGWGMIAALKVVKVLKTHQLAERFYKTHKKKLKLPSNCVVANNPPLQARFTTGLPKGNQLWRGQWQSTGGKLMRPTIKSWDQQYQERAKQYPSFVVTTPIVPNQLKQPTVCSRDQLHSIFGRLPITQAANKISDQEFSELLARL